MSRNTDRPAEGPIWGHVGPSAPAGGGREPLTATDIRITPATGADAETGVIAYVACRYAGLDIDGITIRRMPEGEVAIWFPARKDRRGRNHFIVTPADLKTRETLERAILAAFRETLP